VTAVGIALIVAGVTTGVVALVALHALPTGLSPVRNPVSQYGITRYRTGYRVQTIAYGVAGLGAAIGISTLPVASAVVVGFCGLFAVARTAISWFPMDVPGGDRTRTGRRHGLLAICAFGAVGIAAAKLPNLVDHGHLHPAIAAASGVLALVMVASFVAMGIERRARAAYFGLIERAFYGAMTAWLLVVAVLLARPG